jgi:hypothetical protein
VFSLSYGLNLYVPYYLLELPASEAGTADRCITVHMKGNSC